MNVRDAKSIRIGDTVVYRGHPCRVNSIKVGDIAGPHFRLSPIGDVPDNVRRDIAGLASWRICLLPASPAAPA